MNKEMLQSILESKPIYVFGTSQGYLNYQSFLSQFNVQGFLDNNPAKIGTEFEGKLVHNPAKFDYNSDHYIVIMSSFSDEISAQLNDYGLKNGQHYCTMFDIENSYRLNLMFEHGHYYSPIPDTTKIFKEDYQSYNKSKEMKGIDFNIESQIQLLRELVKSKPNFDQMLKKTDVNFHLNNGFFEYSDAWVYYSFISHFKPKKVIEVGSGFTSALALDTIKDVNLEIDFTFIEPYPSRLLGLLPEFNNSTKLIQDFVQNVSVDQLTDLGENDFLFIDSSHVSKFDSDVNYLFFEVLPHVKPGTIIHFHDVFNGFEYPRDWLYKGRYWNENYLIRAFLQYNSEFEILFFSSHLFNKHPELLSSLGGKGGGGGSIWLRRK